MDQEQVRLGLIACAERQLVVCRLLASGASASRGANLWERDIDELRVDERQGGDLTTLAGSLVITREFLEDVADATFHGNRPWHGVPWAETCVCLEEILASLRESQPVRSETLSAWWNERLAAEVRSASTGKKWWEFWK